MLTQIVPARRRRLCAGRTRNLGRRAAVNQTRPGARRDVKKDSTALLRISARMVNTRYKLA